MKFEFAADALNLRRGHLLPFHDPFQALQLFGRLSLEKKVAKTNLKYQSEFKKLFSDTWIQDRRMNDALQSLHHIGLLQHHTPPFTRVDQAEHPEAAQGFAHHI